MSNEDFSLKLSDYVRLPKIHIWKAKFDCVEPNCTMLSQTKVCNARVSQVYPMERTRPALILWFIHYASTSLDHMEKRATSVSHIPNGIRGCYNVNLKLMLMNHAKITDSCSAANKFQVSRETIRMWRLNIRINTKSTPKYFSGHKHSHCQELEQEIVQFVYLKKQDRQCTNNIKLSCDHITIVCHG